MGNSTESNAKLSRGKRVLIGTAGALGIAAAAFAGSWAATSGAFTPTSHSAPTVAGHDHDGEHDMKCCDDMKGMKMDMPGMNDHAKDHPAEHAPGH